MEATKITKFSIMRNNQDQAMDKIQEVSFKRLKEYPGIDDPERTKKPQLANLVKFISIATREAYSDNIDIDQGAVETYLKANNLIPELANSKDYAEDIINIAVVAHAHKAEFKEFFVRHSTISPIAIKFITDILQLKLDDLTLKSAMIDDMLLGKESLNDEVAPLLAAFPFKGKPNSLFPLDELSKVKVSSWVNNNKAFRKEAFALLGIEYSEHHRHYPPLSGCDSTLQLKSAKDFIAIKQKIFATCEKYKLFQDIEKVGKQISKQKISEFDCKEQYICEGLIQHIFPELKTYSFSGAYGYGSSFKDDDILKIYAKESGAKVIKKKVDGIEFDIVNEKPVILQQGTRGCTAAVAEMLIYEKTEKLDALNLVKTNLGTTETICDRIKKAGLKTIISTPKNLEELQGYIDKHGAAIISVDTELGGHVVIIDNIDINKTSATIRDPYHGWMIDISLESLNEAALMGSEIIQLDLF